MALWCIRVIINKVKNVQGEKAMNASNQKELEWLMFYKDRVRIYVPYNIYAHFPRVFNIKSMTSVFALLAKFLILLKKMPSCVWNTSGIFCSPEMTTN